MRAWTSFRGITPTSVRDRYSDDPFSYNRRRLFGDSTISGNDITVPSANVSRHTQDSKEGFLIELAVPGYSKSDFDVNLDGDVLTISAEKNSNQRKPQAEESENGRPRYSSQEYNYHLFSRSFRLPENVDEDKIVAAYRDGILAVFVPVAEPEAAPAPRRITVG